MPRDYSVDDILSEVLGERKKSPEKKPLDVDKIVDSINAPKKEDESDKILKGVKTNLEPVKEPTVAQPTFEKKSEFEVPVKKHREENPVIDSTDAPTMIHKPDPVKEEEEKLREFVKKEIREQKKDPTPYSIDIPLEDEEKKEPDENEFENYSQAKEMLHRFSTEKIFSGVRLIVTGVCALVLLVLGFWQFFALTNPDFVLQIGNSGIYIAAISLIMTLFAGAISYPVILDGIASFFTFKANCNSPVSLFVLFAAVQSGVFLFDPALFSTHGMWLISPIAVTTLAATELGRFLKISSDKKNFAIISNKKIDKNVCVHVTDNGLVYELTAKMDVTDPVVCTGHPTNFASKFISLSTADTAADKNMRFLAPIIFFGAIMVGILTLIIDDKAGMMGAFQALCAAFALATPMSGMLCATLPLNRANAALRRKNSFISGEDAIESISDTNLVYLDSAELFTSETIHLYVLRTLGDFKIDDCIVDAASITAAAQIPLSNVFLNMVLGDKKLLRKVDSLIYEDGLGLSAWVDGKRVLLGNRELLKTHGIEPPTREFEAKFKVDGREIVYLVNSGDVAAFFVVGYNADEQVFELVQKLADNKIGMLVRNSDSNLTVKKLSYIFDVDPNTIAMVPKTLQNQCDKYTENTMTSPATAVYSGGVSSFVSTLIASIKAKTALSLATMLQIGSIILGYAIVCFFAFVSGIAQVSLPAILAYQLFWLAAIAVIPNLTRYK